jgi:hypothetical protein
MVFLSIIHGRWIFEGCRAKRFSKEAIRRMHYTVVTDEVNKITEILFCNVVCCIC